MRKSSAFSPRRLWDLSPRTIGFGPRAACISLPCAGGAAGEEAWHHKAARTCDRGMNEMRAL